MVMLWLLNDNKGTDYLDYFNPWSTTSGTSYLKTTENMSPEKQNIELILEYSDFLKFYPQDVERAICSLALQLWGIHTWTCAGQVALAISINAGEIEAWSHIILFIVV